LLPYHNDTIMGLLHRKNTSSDLSSTQTHTTNAQGEHISLKQRISSRVHRHESDSGREGGLFHRRKSSTGAYDTSDLTIKRIDEPISTTYASPQYDDIKFPARPSIAITPTLSSGPIVLPAPSEPFTQLQRPNRPPPPPPRNLPSTNDPYARPLPPPRSNRSMSSPARPLPTPVMRVDSLAIVQPYRYPYGEFPDESPQTNAHVQKVISGLFC